MIDKIEGLIAKNKYPSILLMFGEEEYLLEESVHKITAALCPDETSRHDFDMLDGESCSIDDVTRSASAYPFVAERRVVLVKNLNKLFSGRVSKKTEQTSSLSRYLQNPLDTTVLILVADIEQLNGLRASMKSIKGQSKTDKIMSSAKFPYSVILEKYEWIEYPKIWDSDFPQWITSRFRSLGKTIDIEAAELIAANTNPTLRDLSNEIEKLNIFCESKKKISLQDVNFVVCASRVYNVFELQKAVGKRDLKLSLSILERMLAVDRQEILIVTMLTRYFIILFKMIEEASKTTNNFTLAGALRISPYFVPEYLASLQKYREHEIEHAIHELASADEQLKSSSTDSLVVLQKMLISIMD